MSGISNSTNLEKNTISYSKLLGKTLTKIADDYSFECITAAMGIGTGLEEYYKKYQNRYIDVGIAEEHAVTYGAGLAADGKMPVIAIYSTFMQRAYDCILHDFALQKLPGLFCMDRSGLVGNDGPTHHGVFDIAYLRCIPNLSIATPRNAELLQNLLYTAQLGLDHPLAIRYPRGYSQINDLKFKLKKIKLGKGQCLKKGKRYAVLSIGTLAQTIEIALTRVEKPETFAHYDLGFVIPLDTKMLHEVFTKYE